MTPEDEIRRAGKAKEVLENDMFKEACAAIEEAVLDGIKRSAFKDAELREKLCQQYVMLHALKDQLRTYMESGQLAEAQILQDERMEAFRKATITY